MALQVTDEHYDSGFTLDDVTFDLLKGYIMDRSALTAPANPPHQTHSFNMIHRDAGSIHVLGLDNVADESPSRNNSAWYSIQLAEEQRKVKNVERIVAPLYSSWDGGCYRKYLVLLPRCTELRKKHIKDLSAVCRFRLMLAIALSHDAKLLILDEPTSGLDEAARDELMDILHAYIEDGEHSVLFSTHITADLERAADFITYIDGRLYYTGPKETSLRESFRPD